MRGYGLASAAAAAVSLLAPLVSAQADTVAPIVTKGQHFFYKSNGTEFFIRGVAYQQGVGSNGTISNAPYVDPLADADACRRDIPYLARLRTNTIRVYAVDPTQNHDDCMNMLAAAGIYVISDLGQPIQSIQSNDPAWDDELYSRYTAVIDMFSKYNNVIGFFAGNEVSNMPNNTAASAYVKAAVRDSKAYIKNQGYRTMYVGYATYDGPIRNELAEYFNCGPEENAIDFWGYNVYSWCGMSNYQESSYDERTQFFHEYSVPIFFAEYGCNNVEPRPFTEVGALFGPLMTPTWSGGIVYMYFQEENHYGLVDIDGDTVTPNQDFDNLSSQMAKASPSMTNMNAYSPTFSPTTCPSNGPSWAPKASPLPPTPNQELCQCMVAGAQCAASSDNMTAYKDVFDYICGRAPKACDGIVSNATTGDFGAFSVCNPKEKLTFVMNHYYQNSQDQASACDFNGMASSQSAASPSGACSSILSQAGPEGQGSVAQPTGKGGDTYASQYNNFGSDAGASGSSASGSSSPGAGASLSVHHVNIGMFTFGAYIATAVLAGAGMILL